LAGGTPASLKRRHRHQEHAALFTRLVFACFALPVVVGLGSPISILIFAFGLYRA
jgi:hypothetical protein